MPYIGSLAGSDALLTAVGRATRRRLRALAPAIERAGGPRAGALLRSALRRMGRREPPGERPLEGARIRGWLHTLEQGLRLERGAARAVALERGPERERLLAGLFAELADSPHLRRAAPRQRIDRGFARRAGLIGRELTRGALAELPVLFGPHAGDERPGSTWPLLPREDADLAFPRGEYPLGGLSLVLACRDPGAALAVGQGRLRLLARGRVLADAPSGEPLGLRGPGVRTFDLPRLAPGARPRLGRRLVSTPRVLRVAAPVPELAGRLAAALRLLGRVWVEASGEVERFTDLVVPLAEPGTVSYSLPSRPGVSYINLWGKTLLELADDLLHEAAHHKLHAIEELEPLVDDPGEALWWSPWREAWRPLRGILHACYTFTHGGLLFAHLLAAGEPGLDAARRRFARRRLLEEELRLGHSLADLERAARQGRLRLAGKELVGEMRSIHRRLLAPEGRKAERGLRKEGARGRAILAALASERGELARLRRAQPGVTASIRRGA